MSNTELHMERLKAEVRAEQRDRRERIATAALQSVLLLSPHLGETTTYADYAKHAVDAADALIAELDKEQPR